MYYFPTMNAKLLLLLPATAAAFSVQHAIPREISALKVSAIDVHESMDIETKMKDQINQVLMAQREALLSEQSKVDAQHPQSTVDADNQILKDCSTEEKIHQILLSGRFNLPFLDRTEVKQSTIESAGRGLFATKDIARGDIITCYPGDAILYDIPVSDNEDIDHDDYEEEDKEVTDSICLFGGHVPTEHIWDEDTVFDGSDTKPALTAYALSVDDDYSVMGHPDLDINPAYAGHYVNDAAGHLALDKQSNLEAAIALGLDIAGFEDEDDDDDEIGVEENIAAYVLQSIESSNGMHRSVNEEGTHIVTVATKDIAKGQEIFVTYGPDYWLGHAL